MALKLEDKLKELSEYNIGFEIKQGYYHISITFDKQWAILETQNANIHIEMRNGVTHYIASSDNTSIEDLFKAVGDTITYNTDLQKKLALFKEKSDELREIFSKETLDVLKTITFQYGKPKRRGRPRKKTGEKVEETKQKKEDVVVEDKAQTKLNIDNLSDIKPSDSDALILPIATTAEKETNTKTQEKI